MYLAFKLNNNSRLDLILLGKEVSRLKGKIFINHNIYYAELNNENDMKELLDFSSKYKIEIILIGLVKGEMFYNLNSIIEKPSKINLIKYIKTILVETMKLGSLNRLKRKGYILSIISTLIRKNV